MWSVSAHLMLIAIPLALATHAGWRGTPQLPELSQRTSNVQKKYTHLPDMWMRSPRLARQQLQHGIHFVYTIVSAKLRRRTCSSFVKDARELMALNFQRAARVSLRCRIAHYAGAGALVDKYDSKALNTARVRWRRRRPCLSHAHTATATCLCTAASKSGHPQISIYVKCALTNK